VFLFSAYLILIARYQITGEQTYVEGTVIVSTVQVSKFCLNVEQNGPNSRDVVTILEPVDPRTFHASCRIRWATSTAAR
jgi:hypothetical protein